MADATWLCTIDPDPALPPDAPCTLADVPSYYQERFRVQVVNGKGLGQSRRIVDVLLDEDTWKVIVDPPWDVIPDEDSVVMATIQAWQTYLVGNTVDVSTLCSGKS